MGWGVNEPPKATILGRGRNGGQEGREESDTALLRLGGCRTGPVHVRAWSLTCLPRPISQKTMSGRPASAYSLVRVLGMDSAAYGPLRPRMEVGFCGRRPKTAALAWFLGLGGWGRRDAVARAADPGNAPHWRGGGALAQGGQVPPWPPGVGLSLRLLVTQPSAMWNRCMVSA